MNASLLSEMGAQKRERSDADRPSATFMRHDAGETAVRIVDSTVL